MGIFRIEQPAKVSGRPSAAMASRRVGDGRFPRCCTILRKRSRLFASQRTQPSVSGRGRLRPRLISIRRYCSFILVSKGNVSSTLRENMGRSNSDFDACPGCCRTIGFGSPDHQSSIGRVFRSGADRDPGGRTDLVVWSRSQGGD